MQNNKLTARIVGSLFITGTVAGILSVVATGAVLNGSNLLVNVYKNETRVIVGALLVLIMGFSLSMIPIVLFPIFKKYNEALALGAVVFRGVLEAVAYILVALSWLLLLSVGREYAEASTTDLATLHGLSLLLQALEDWSVHIISIVFSLGALMIYWLFYISRLIPRWLAVWGLVGAVLYLITPLLGMFGHGQFGVLMAPLALQEMVLAVWLIVKGFNANTSTVTPSSHKR